MGLLSRVAQEIFTPRSLNRQKTLGAVERMGAATHLVASLEFLARRQDRRPGGVNDWAISRQNVRYRNKAARQFFDFTSQPAVNTALHVARILAAGFLLAPTTGMRKSRLAANTIIAGSSVCLFPGQMYGTDGSDQASFLVQAAAMVARSSRQPKVVDAALWFLALQSTLNYTASGWVKVTSPTWRSGVALPGVLRTMAYGHEGSWRAAERFPRSAKALGHGVLALECLFPAAFLLGGRVTPAFIGSAAAFHLANARVMGLGRFVGAFCAMHPAVLYATDPRRRVAGTTPDSSPRSDVLPAVAGGLAVAAYVVLLARQEGYRRAVDAQRRQQRGLDTSLGNTLHFDVRNPDASGPVVFFETGLASTDQHWEWIRREIGDELTTVSYHRAGYGTSTYHNDSGYSLDQSASEFAELADHVAPDRDILLVGHSLGGYIALLSAALLGPRVRAVALLDASHPAELQRSERQRGGVAAVDSNLRFMKISLRLGLGPLLKEVDGFNQLPSDVRRPALAQFRDSRMWTASYREWRATRREFSAFDGALPNLSARMLVLTAGATAADDPVQVDLHQELGNLGKDATFHIVQGADHQSLLSHPDHAKVVAAHISRLIAECTGELHA
jgi:pimeloyl-ACP methyl ester carboxylesterase